MFFNSKVIIKIYIHEGMGGGWDGDEMGGVGF